MVNLIYPSEYFNANDTLECGQIFRFVKNGNGYNLFSADKMCKIVTVGDQTVITCQKNDEQYFRNFFDQNTDYANIVCRARESGYQVLAKAAQLGKGVRILRQDAQEMLFSFLISQNNNIPRIKSTIEKLCTALGEQKNFNGENYYAFPTLNALDGASVDFYKQIGLGYRAEYMKNLSAQLKDGLLCEIADKDACFVKKRLMQIKGIGEKVADCACLFGLYKTESFPVDVWIEKIYKEDFYGTLSDRKKITAFFTQKFGVYSGYFQQYLFYYKRTLEKSIK